MNFTDFMDEMTEVYGSEGEIDWEVEIHTFGGGRFVVDSVGLVNDKYVIIARSK